MIGAYDSVRAQEKVALGVWYERSQSCLDSLHLNCLL
jgi:hypothetical protein